MTGNEGTVRVEVSPSGRFPTLRDSDVESSIARCEYDVKDKRLTICTLYAVNGFVLTGESACVDARNFDPKLGRELARQKAKDKLWELEGYLLKQRIFESQQVPQRF